MGKEDVTTKKTEEVVDKEKEVKAEEVEKPIDPYTGNWRIKNQSAVSAVEFFMLAGRAVELTTSHCEMVVLKHFP